MPKSPKSGYQPTKPLDTSKPPQGGSGLATCGLAMEIKPKTTFELDPRAISGTTMQIGGSLNSILLRGFRGSGKTEFYLSDLKRAVATIYIRLYGQELNWKTYHTWTQETKQKVRESAKHCMMCIIDMDYEGQEKNIEKKQVIPPEIVGSISKMGISGVTDVDGIRFHEAQYARDYYLRKLRWHKLFKLLSFQSTLTKIPPSLKAFQAG